MSEVKKCIDVIKSGGIILYPTDTIYGLGCDALNMNANKRINIIKGSNPKKPLIYFGLLPVTSIILVDAVNTTFAPRTASFSTLTPSTTMQRDPKKTLSSIMTGDA